MTEFITRSHKGNWFEVAIKTDDKKHYLAAQNFARSLIGHEKPCEMHELRKAVKLLGKNYERGLNSDYVRNPVAWAMYQTWKEMDGGADNA